MPVSSQAQKLLLTLIKLSPEARNWIGSQIAKRPDHKIDLRFEPSIDVDKLALKYHRHELRVN